MIPFNKPYITGKELGYIQEAIATGKISGNGHFSKLCHSFFEKRYGFKKCLLTSSCTDGLEMAALLVNIKPGDEVIIPSYTFVSSANAFVLRGAKIVFVDSRTDHPGMDEEAIEPLITARTKAIVVVHYAGVAVDMDKVMVLAEKYNLLVIEDAAQCIESYYNKADQTSAPLGSIGHLAAFSFHETKNIISGEGGMLVINDPQFLHRAEIIWEKGTNRSSFFRGEVDKYGWVDVGSSFLPSEVTAAFLYAQLEELESIQLMRKTIWDRYESGLKDWAAQYGIRMPYIPDYATNNAHMFYLVFESMEKRESFIDLLKSAGILSVFHYQSLHASPFYLSSHDGRELPKSDLYTENLVRLPLYAGLSEEEQSFIISQILKFKG